MWCRSYRDHAIMPFPSFDAASRHWLCQANITWVSGPQRESVFLRFPDRVDSEGDAVAISLQAAQEWIDNHVQQQRLQDSALLSTPTARSPAIRRQTSLGRKKTPKSSPRTLTFEQFKSFVKSWPHSGGENSLHKSYTALLLLRKKRHRSWAEIKPKLRTLGARSVQPRSMRETKLPLTTKDWRRII